MWTLPKINFPRAALKSGLERMREASHGAMTTEQAHASGSIMMRMHKAYGDAHHALTEHSLSKRGHS